VAGVTGRLDGSVLGPVEQEPELAGNRRARMVRTVHSDLDVLYGRQTVERGDNPERQPDAQRLQ
jgi:hypothetical protein